MKLTSCIAIVVAGSFLSNTSASGQGFMKKLKDKANQALEKSVGVPSASSSTSNETSTSTNTSGGGGGSSSSSSSSSGRPSNKGGAGLTNTTPPDVAQQIVDAEKAYKTASYSEARYSVQQALLGVELQLGREILKSLPQTVSGLATDTTKDRVTSTSWGWSNLTIQRIYNKDDKQLEMTVGNMPMYAGLANIYFSGVYSQSSGDNPNVKQIKVKGNKAIIKYDQNEGYTVLVPLGQSGMIAWQGINFANETDMMTAVNTFDVDRVKKLLGEK